MRGPDGQVCLMSSGPTWRVQVRWEDGHQAEFTYVGPLWVGRVSEEIRIRAEAEHAQRREADPTLPARLAYQVLSYRRHGVRDDNRASPNPLLYRPES
ncbi:hypothetical protein GCM10008957_55740 [Deinococcus ruber]|uniref:Uncharacterized protein n=1 Tax=Deinococcus ruber TaxID=1848197 RepID=A0A918FIQ9_9DEIO|nr:hypothetical protein GCM10008957_55740 [Deinococcus ruber]